MNYTGQSISKTKKEIVKQHTLTYFNFLNIFLAVLIVISGQLQNLTFIGVMVANTILGIIQEFKVKKTIDKLSVVTVEKVKTANFKIVFDPTLVRGMSYYTGPIFEIAMDEFGGSVGGGGRYDEMIGKFTGNNTCACGFSIGFERIVMLLLERDYKVPSAAQKKAYLIDKKASADVIAEVIEKAKAEREKGIIVAINIMKKNKKFQKEQLMADGYEEIEMIYAD